MSMEPERFEQSQRKLKEISEKFNSVKEADSQLITKEWCCVSEIISSIEELQSLISWIAEKRGEKEGSSVIAEKLQQLGKIRRVLEKSASESKHQLQELRKEDSVPYIKPSLERKAGIYEECCSSETNFNSFKGCRSNFVCSNHNNIYSKKYESNQLVSESFVDLVQETEDLHDSLGTAVSEDEGLGEESRRGDLLAISSLSEMSDHSSISNDTILDAPLEFTDPIAHIYKDQLNTDWLNESCQRNSVELCLAAVSKLKESLLIKEKEITKLRAAKTNKNEIAELHLVVRNLQKNIDDLQSSIFIFEKENSTLKEQVLELEEAENDARLQGQRLEEKLCFLQEKDSHFQVELSETKHALELCLEELSLKDVEERELQSQLRFMEVLVQKYEEQIGQIDSLQRNPVWEPGFKNTVKNEIIKGESKVNKLKIDERNINSSPDSTNECSVDLLDSINSCDKIPDCQLVTNCSEFQCHDVQYCSNDSNLKDISVQTDFIAIEPSKKLKTCCVQTTCPENPHAKEVKHAMDASVEKKSSENYSGPIQQELLTRLHHLVEEDAHLQQQLYQVDQINLALWQKLHSLQFNIGECQRENVSGEDNYNKEECSEIPLDSSHPQTAGVIKNQKEKNSKTFECTSSLGCSEERLRDCLLRLEKINAMFLKKLQQREKLCSEKENKRAEWITKEDLLTKSLQETLDEKEYIHDQVVQLEAQNAQLSSEMEKMNTKLEILCEEHRETISNIIAERDEKLNELQNKIDYLLIQEKECLKQITKFKKEKNKIEDNESQALKSNYVQVQLELVKHRDDLEAMKHGFTLQLQNIVDQHNVTKEKLNHDVDAYRGKEIFIAKKLQELQPKHQELQDTSKQIQNELEEEKLKLSDGTENNEREHKLIENELQNILLQMEQETALATKALSEERNKLEKELQENISDLQSKEEVYKTRIMELESNVSQLRTDLHRLTGDSMKLNSDSHRGNMSNFHHDHLVNELRELRAQEIELREKLEEMEKKEAAYEETLEHADRIVATVERGYKNKIEELEMSERSLKQRIGYLEDVENRLRVTLQKERRSLNGRTPDDLLTEVTESEKRENIMKEQIISLEQLQRGNQQRVKELEKIRETLELKVNDYEEQELSLKKLQQEHDNMRKELAKIKISESSLQMALAQTENLLESRELEVKADMKMYTKEKKDLEETIIQLRFQVRELKQRLEKHTLEEESVDELIFKDRPLLLDLQPVCFSTEVDNQLQLTETVKVENEGGKYEPVFDNKYPMNDRAYPCSSDTKQSSTTNRKENFEADESSKIMMVACASENSRQETEGESLKSPGDIYTKTEHFGPSQEPTNNKEKKLYKPGQIIPFESEYCNPLIDDKAEREYSFACHELEECMLRAIGVVETQMENKKNPLMVETIDYNSFTPPSQLCILQQVGSEAVLIGWDYPDTSALAGFELYVDGHLYEKVYVPDRRKAVIRSLDFTKPLTLSICAVSTSGQISEKQTLNLTLSCSEMEETF